MHYSMAALEIDSISQPPEKKLSLIQACVRFGNKWTTAPNACMNVIDESELTQLNNRSHRGAEQHVGNISDPSWMGASSLEYIFTCGAREFFRQAGSAREQTRMPIPQRTLNCCIASRRTTQGQSYLQPSGFPGNTSRTLARPARPMAHSEGHPRGYLSP